MQDQKTLSAEGDVIEVRWATGSLDEARKVCRYLVQERLVACAQIIPWIESIFMWNNQLETSQESLVLLKTTRTLFEKVKQVILQNCSYQLPEILIFNVDGGLQDYLNWVCDSAQDYSNIPAMQTKQT